MDGTVRPQILRESDNAPVHAILREYHALTGLPGLINTSFNMHEEPKSAPPPMPAAPSPPPASTR